jgi:hypothetical protein
MGDLLWWFKKDEVLNEISNIMGIGGVDTNTPGWFQHRMAATQNILNNMTDTALNDLQMKGEEVAERGMPEDMKRK